MYRLFKQSVANPELTSPSQEFLFDVVQAYITAAGALFSNEELFQDEWWERGELYRLISPIAFTMEYLTHPLGGRKVIKHCAEMAQREHGPVDTFGPFIDSIAVNVVKPVMILNRLLTSGRLATRMNPDMRLLEKSVLKQDMVVSTVMLMCEEICNGVMQGYVVVSSLPWRTFTDVWQNFNNGAGFESFVSACGDAAIRIEERGSLVLLLSGIQYLNTVKMSELSTTNGQQTTESNVSKSQTQCTLDFLFLWSLILITGLENEREKMRIHVEAGNSHNRSSGSSSTSYLGQASYSQFLLHLKSDISLGSISPRTTKLFVKNLYGQMFVYSKLFTLGIIILCLLVEKLSSRV